MSNGPDVVFRVGVPYRTFQVKALEVHGRQLTGVPPVTRNMVDLLIVTGEIITPMWDWVNATKRKFKAIDLNQPDILKLRLTDHILIATIGLDNATASLFKLAWQSDGDFLLEQTKL